MLVAELKVGQGQPSHLGIRGIPQKFIDNTWEEFDKIVNPQLEWLQENNLPLRLLITNPGGYYPGVMPFDGIVQAREEGLGDFIEAVHDYVAESINCRIEVDIYLGDPQELLEQTKGQPLNERITRFRESIDIFQNCNLHADRGARVIFESLLWALSIRFEKLYLEGQFTNPTALRMRQFGHNSIMSNVDYPPEQFSPVQKGDFVYIYRSTSSEHRNETIRKYLAIGCYCSLNLRHLAEDGVKYKDLIHE